MPLQERLAVRVIKHMNKQKYLLAVIVIAVLIAGGFLFVKKAQAPHVGNQPAASSIQQLPTNTPQTSNQSSVINNQPAQQAQPQKATVDPIENALARITKKPFGIFITPKTSPVQPERFAGYHTGTDLETYPSEQNIDVPVRALCDGKLLVARFASGYGGVAVESCTLDGQAVTVVYGHIRLASVAPKIGAQIKAGDFLANLGTGYSNETDGERKHLHLGIHKGTSVNILGYVQSKSELSGWIDAAQYLQ